MRNVYWGIKFAVPDPEGTSWLVASRPPKGRNPRSDLEPKVSGLGSQRDRYSTIMNANGGADAVINGGLKTV